MVNQPIGNHGLGIFWCGRIYLGPLLQGQTRIAKLRNRNLLNVINCLGEASKSKRISRPRPPPPPPPPPPPNFLQ